MKTVENSLKCFKTVENDSGSEFSSSVFQFPSFLFSKFPSRMGAEVSGRGAEGEQQGSGRGANTLTMHSATANVFSLSEPNLLNLRPMSFHNFFLRRNLFAMNRFDLQNLKMRVIKGFY